MLLYKTPALVGDTVKVKVFQYKNRLKFVDNQFEAKKIQRIPTMKSRIFLPQMINGDLNWVIQCKLSYLYQIIIPSFFIAKDLDAIYEN